MMDFNQFFRFSLIITSSSIVCTFFIYIYSFSPVKYNHISWQDIKLITSPLGTSFECISTIQAEFKKCDTNNDSYLTFHQFMHFVSHSFILWQPLYKFRESCWEYIFPVEHVVQILYRKSKMPEIRKYQLDNNGKLPPLTCKQKFHKLISGEPHPYLYYYDSGKEEIYLENLILDRIRFMFPHRKVYKVTYNMEGVIRLIPNIKKDPVEYYYIHYFKRNVSNHNSGVGNHLKMRNNQDSMKSSLNFNGSASCRSILRNVQSTKNQNGNNQECAGGNGNGNGNNRGNDPISCLMSPDGTYRNSVELLDIDHSTTITPSSNNTTTRISTNITISVYNSQVHNSIRNFQANNPSQNNPSQTNPSQNNP